MEQGAPVVTWRNSLRSGSSMGSRAERPLDCESAHHVGLNPDFREPIGLQCKPSLSFASAVMMPWSELAVGQ
eukprot:scaffold80369_cov31-Tisochrysis_lutea.AAC.2